MQLFRKLFGKSKSDVVSIKPFIKSTDFVVEFYPLTNRYYPKYKDYYMRENSHTGIIELRDDTSFAYSDYGNTEAEADKIINKFKEQQLKVNVQIIKK